MKDRDVSEDIAQDSFFVLWEKKGEISVSVKSYLYRIAVNRSFNHLRESRRFTETRDGDLTEFAPSENVTENQVNLSFTEKELDRAIDQVPPACRVVFIMSRMDGLSYREIAEAMQISVKTVENQMTKALRILREQLAGTVISLIFLLFLNF